MAEHYAVERKTKYIDPATGSHWIVEGNAKRISAKLGRVAILLMMKAGSVPGTTWFCCGLRDIKRRDSRLADRILATVDKALRPHQSTATYDGLYDSYERTVVFEGTIPILTLTIKNGEGVATTSIPLASDA